MAENYKILLKGGSGEVSEKKSHFISAAFPINCEEEALEFVEAVKKKYWDASHNCYAYVLGKSQEIQRCSDDGEPNKTAGRPILDVLLGEDIHNAIIIVTRYFGGTLLGTGGLVRAYTKAAQMGLSDSVTVEKCKGKRLSLKTDYNGIGKIQYICSQMEVKILNTSYTDTVEAEVMVPFGAEEMLKKKITEGTNGKALYTYAIDAYYGMLNGEILLFEN